MSLWNAGCRVRFEFLGPCEAAARYESQVDFRVRWVSFDTSMQIREGQSYPGSRSSVPTAADLTACTKAIQTKYGTR